MKKFYKKSAMGLMAWQLVEIFLIALTVFGFFSFVSAFFGDQEYVKRSLMREIALSASALSLSNSSSYYVVDLPDFDPTFVFAAENGKITIYESEVSSNALEDFLFAHSYMDVVTPATLFEKEFEFDSSSAINITIDSKGKLEFKEVVAQK